jgi:hypothetical protein
MARSLSPLEFLIKIRVSGRKGVWCCTIKFIFIDLVFHNKRRRCYQDDSVVVFEDLVSGYLCFTRIQKKDALYSAIVDIVLDNGRVNTGFTSESYPRFDIIMNFVGFNMSRGLFLDQDSLLHVFKDKVFDNNRMGVMVYLDTSHFIKADFIHIEYPRGAVLPFNPDPVFHILFDIIMKDFPITSDVFSTKRTVRPAIDPMLIVPLDDVVF